MTDILEGVNEKSRRADLFGRLREASKRIAKLEDAATKAERKSNDERVAKMQEIEERIRSSFQRADVDLRSITLMSTEAEFAELIDFLENFEDIMPIAMHRLLAGAKAVTGSEDVAT